MKWCRFNLYLSFLFFSVFNQGFAQNPVKTDNYHFTAEDSVGYNQSIPREKLLRYTNHWQKLIPRYQKIQFAGSMGLVSVGVGWEYGKDHWESDLLVGFIPPFQDEKGKATLTLKQNYIPWELCIGQSPWTIEPLTTGLYMNSILDDRFWKKEPNRYPDNYYKFSTRIRFHIFLGQRISFHIQNPKRLHQSISVFYEISSCDLYIISAVNNRILRPRDYMSLSFGLKLQIF